jgi:hypothetical protein
MKKKAKIIIFVILGVIGLLAVLLAALIIKANSDMDELEILNRKMEQQIQILKERQAVRP